MNPFWRAYFSNGLAQPPASQVWKEPVNELRVSALGSALDVAAVVASRMERDQIGVLDVWLR